MISISSFSYYLILLSFVHIFLELQGVGSSDSVKSVNSNDSNDVSLTLTDGAIGMYIDNRHWTALPFAMIIRPTGTQMYGSQSFIESILEVDMRNIPTSSVKRKSLSLAIWSKRTRRDSSNGGGNGGCGFAETGTDACADAEAGADSSSSYPHNDRNKRADDSISSHIRSRGRADIDRDFSLVTVISDFGDIGSGGGRFAHEGRFGVEVVIGMTSLHYIYI